MRHKFKLLIAASLLQACAAELPAAPDLSSVIMDKNEGCLEGPTAQFGRYLGDWNIQDWQLQPDGKSWVEQKGARWNFTCFGNGVAVQDFWMPNGGGAGTNLRMYNPKTEKWDIAWTATGAPGFSHITARQNEDGHIVMDYVSPKKNPPQRITFFTPTGEGWNWKLEQSFDGEKSWVEVYRIKATPRDVISGDE